MIVDAVRANHLYLVQTEQPSREHLLTAESETGLWGWFIEPRVLFPHSKWLNLKKPYCLSNSKLLVSIWPYDLFFGIHISLFVPANFWAKPITEYAAAAQVSSISHHRQTKLSCILKIKPFTAGTCHRFCNRYARASLEEMSGTRMAGSSGANALKTASESSSRLAEEDELRNNR